MTPSYTPPTSPPDGGAQRKATASNANLGGNERLLSLLTGGALAAGGLVYAVTRRSPLGLLPVLAGGLLAYRGLSAHSVLYEALGASTDEDTVAQPNGQSVIDRNPLTRPIHVERTVTINAQPDDLYAYWRNFENLPNIMQHLESVTMDSDGRSHWVAKAPLGASVEWDAEIVEDQPGEQIAWRSLADAQVQNAGVVRFRPAPPGRGTEVLVTLDYTPPGGVLGAAVAKLFGEEPLQQVQDDLRHFKQVMETGEVATTEGQPSARAKKEK